MDIEVLKEELDACYAKIADASNEEIDALLDEAHRLEDEIDFFQNPPAPPLSQSEWASEYSIEREYERFHDEYGDAAASFNSYSDYHYQTYLETVKNRGYYSFS